MSAVQEIASRIHLATDDELAEIERLLRAEQAEQATATPSDVAEYMSEGQWRTAPHLDVLNRALLDACHGEGPNRLIVTLPPRHGKSELCSRYTPVWFLGRWPRRRVILASYGDNFAADWGRRCRNLMEHYGESLFGVRVAQDSSAANRWNIADHEGGMVTVGVGSGVTGRGGDLIIIDDPVKDAQEADSEVYRERTWEWWQSTISTRLEPEGVIVLIQTRWHEDDLAGRLLSGNADEWHEIRFPALAEEDDILGRKPGDPLWPERFNKTVLERTRNRLSSRWWNALYQQRPTAAEGDMFRRSWFKQRIRTAPHRGRAIRYWDKAGTPGGGDYTVGVLIVEWDGIWVVADVVRGQWSYREREETILETARRDGETYQNYQVFIEREPGASGVESVQRTIRMLAGFAAYEDNVTGRKEVRWQPWAAQLEAGNVVLVEGEWNRTFVDEHLAAPNGRHDDQIDAASGAFNKMATERRMTDEDADRWIRLLG